MNNDKQTFTLEEANLIAFALEYLKWNSPLLSNEFPSMRASIVHKVMKMTQDLDTGLEIG
jgi:hypothetical protein